jgi:TolB-like protein/predicted Ser/Thr protein kinase
MQAPPEALCAALASRYKVERELGQGGMATVYLARDLKHRRQVAIKIVRPDVAAALGSERFLREIDLAASLTHPHILPLYDSGEAGGFLYYVMPYVEGESLRAKLDREKQLPLEDALRIAREVADALSHAHSHGVVHRDIKPANILLESGHAVVADFGIARAVSASGGLNEPGWPVGPVLARLRAVRDARGAAAVHGADGGEPGAPAPLRGAAPGDGCAADGAGLVDGRVAARVGKGAGRPVHDRRAAGRGARASRGRRGHADDGRADDRFVNHATSGCAIGSPRQPRRPPLGHLRRGPGARGAGKRSPLPVAVGLATCRRGRPPAHRDCRPPASEPERRRAERLLRGGLHDGLLTQLSKVASLKVISRTSVMGYQGTTKPLRQIADELGVGSIVEGSVQVVNGRLRVNVQLIDAATDEHLWAERYDRTLDDAFAIQSEVAQ